MLKEEYLNNDSSEVNRIIIKDVSGLSSQQMKLNMYYKKKLRNSKEEQISNDKNVRKKYSKEEEFILIDKENDILRNFLINLKNERKVKNKIKNYLMIRNQSSLEKNKNRINNKLCNYNIPNFAFSIMFFYTKISSKIYLKTKLNCFIYKFYS